MRAANPEWWWVDRCASRGGSAPVARFARVLGFDVSTLQRGQTWSSDDLGEPLELEVGIRQVGDHAGLAVVVSIAADATKDVMSSLGEVPVGRMLTVAPAAGTGARSVPDGRTAASLAVAIRNVVREHLDGGTDLIHLFLAAPAGLALLLGHRWNALRPTVVYEHLASAWATSPPSGFRPEFVDYLALRSGSAAGSNVWQQRSRPHLWCVLGAHRASTGL